MARRTDNILAFTWYLEADYEKLLEVTDDDDGLRQNYHQWLVEARRALVNYKRRGFDPRRVYIDVDEYVEWCQSRDRPVDAKSREMFKEIQRQAFYREIDRND
ncbi:MAG: hypothetical protein ACLFVJ_03345 [Persicimonas sp.]